MKKFILVLAVLLAVFTASAFERYTERVSITHSYCERPIWKPEMIRDIQKNLPKKILKSKAIGIAYMQVSGQYVGNQMTIVKFSCVLVQTEEEKVMYDGFYFADFHEGITQEYAENAAYKVSKIVSKMED